MSMCVVLARRRRAPLKVMARDGDHGQAALGRERDAEVALGRVVGFEHEAKALREGGEDELGLHHREAFADAGALAGAEREIGALMAVARALGVEASGVERMVAERRATEGDAGPPIPVEDVTAGPRDDLIRGAPRLSRKERERRTCHGTDDV